MRHRLRYHPAQVMIRAMMITMIAPMIAMITWSRKGAKPPGERLILDA
jgi:hypothetical protein